MLDQDERKCRMLFLMPIVRRRSSCFPYFCSVCHVIRSRIIKYIFHGSFVPSTSRFQSARAPMLKCLHTQGREEDEDTHHRFTRMVHARVCLTHDISLNIDCIFGIIDEFDEGMSTCIHLLLSSCSCSMATQSIMQGVCL